MEMGFRQVTNSQRPLETIEDFQGLKIRLQPNEVHLDTFRAIGASPVSMDISEVYSALQQGVVDGQEQPYSLTNTHRLDEVQSYFSDTKHFYDFIVVLINRNVFNNLSDTQQKNVHEAMSKAVAWQREKAGQENEAARQTLIERGMQFTEIGDKTRSQLRKATQGVVEDLREEVGAELVDQVLEESGS
ncbi:TRAP transporter substrate-binding protein [Halomonas piscis]|uniref:TRAP transporter substrate-binding protein n=1 Tax=Halomonas piscis TaxID=3031727 RepID=A0ABY9YY72_9GAMM|nr:TRAP transporter substrate-binding protein [Halomonas piscis]WNK19772.1 TRAP transporter substrate-binding protein [Halomonas piscis]